MQDQTQALQSTQSDLASKLQPQSLEQLMKFADRIMQSRLCPQHFEDPADIVLVAQQGAELGLNVMTALQNSHVIHGQVGWDADLMKALCMRTGEVKQWTYGEKSAARCEVTVQRAGYDPETFVWTKKKAQHIGLWSKGVWQDHPDTMLRHRVDADAARSIFPDVVAGVYTPSEIREANASAEVVDAPAAQIETDASGGQKPDSGQSVIEATARPTPDHEESEDAEGDAGDGEPDGDDLKSIRRSVGQLLRNAAVSKSESDSFKSALMKSGVWSNADALQRQREELSSADDRAELVRSVIGTSEGEADDDESPPLWARVADASPVHAELVAKIRDEVDGDDEASAVLKHAATKGALDCYPEEIPELQESTISSFLRQHMNGARQVHDYCEKALDEIPY